MVVPLFPAVKDVCPEDVNNLGVECMSIDFVLAAGGGPTVQISNCSRAYPSQSPAVL